MSSTLTTPEQRPFTAHGGAVAMWRDRGPEVVLEGPAGTGKTRSILEKAHYCAMKYPGTRILLCRKTRESMTESVLVTFEEKVLPENSPIGLGAARRTRSSYNYPNRSEIIVAGLLSNGRDQKAKIMSTEFDMICIFEATELTEHEYEQLLTRLRNGRMPYQQLVADCNPDAPTHWLHRRCDQRVATVHFSRHEDNPSLYDKKRGRWTAMGGPYISRLDRLTGVRKERLRFGRRAAAEGTVYEFDRDKHMVDAMPAGWESWRKFRAVDFGYTNPFVCQWWAVDPDGRLYRYREIYRTQTLVEDHAKRIKELSEGERYDVTVADHDAEDRATLHRHGIRTDPAHKAVQEGIQAVQERMRIEDDGRPRIFYLRGALVEADPLLEEAKKPTCTEQEFDSYVWPKSADGKPVKEEPVKVDDHGMDCSRYAVAYADNIARRPKVNIRILGA